MGDLAPGGLVLCIVFVGVEMRLNWFQIGCCCLCVVV